MRRFKSFKNMAEEEEDFYVPIDENDSMVRPLKAFVKTWMEYEKVRSEVFIFCCERWESIMAFDNSINTVKSYLEFCLPEVLKNQMALCRQYKGYALDNIPMNERINLDIARKERKNINNLISRLFTQLRKCYGDDVPPFNSPSKSVNKKNKTSKVKSPETKPKEPETKPKEPETKPKEPEKLREELVEENYDDESKAMSKSMSFKPPKSITMRSKATSEFGDKGIYKALVLDLKNSVIEYLNEYYNEWVMDNLASIFDDKLKELEEDNEEDDEDDDEETGTFHTTA